MEHKHSIVIHQNESGHARIWILDYENAKQVGDMRELPPGPGYDAILGAIDSEYEPLVQTQVDAGALAKSIAMQCAERFSFNPDSDEPSYPRLEDIAVVTTSIKLEIERALAGITPDADEARSSSEAVESAAVSNEDITETKPLSAAE